MYRLGVGQGDFAGSGSKKKACCLYGLSMLMLVSQSDKSGRAISLSYICSSNIPIIGAGGRGMELGPAARFPLY
jgi:hypothetical protein